MNYFYLFLLFSICSFSQHKTIEVNSYITKLIFEEPIEFVEESSAGIVIEHKIIDKNILFLNSLKDVNSFETTNLFIKTVSGYYFDYLLEFNKNKNETIKRYFIPFDQAINYNQISIKKNNDSLEIETKSTSKKIDSLKIPQVVSKQNDSHKYESELNLIIAEKPSFRRAIWEENDLIVQVCNVFVKNHKVYYHIKIVNNSGISYSIKFFKFLVTTKPRRNKNSSIVREYKESDLIISPNDLREIKAKRTQDFVFILDETSINSKEQFNIEIKENNGSRDFQLYIPSKIVNNPKILE